MNSLLLIGIIGLVGWILVSPNNETKQSKSLQTNQIESPNPMPSPKMQFEKAESVLKVGHTYTAILTTSLGDITIELKNNVPNTTNNFVFLAQKGFYDGVIFHRVIPGFMIQGGDPTGTGMGGPGYKFEDEPFEGEYKRGIVAMANAGPNTNGSQFFIMHADYPLPPNYVIFGEVTSGMETVDQIAALKTATNDRPIDPPTITRVVISENN